MISLHEVLKKVGSSGLTCSLHPKVSAPNPEKLCQERDDPVSELQASRVPCSNTFRVFRILGLQRSRV